MSCGFSVSLSASWKCNKEAKATNQATRFFGGKQKKKKKKKKKNNKQ
jgi:hypothetical protein